MNCDCSVSFGNDFYCLQDKMITARKRHTCRECGSLIMPGEKYQLYKCVGEGAIFTSKTCVTCVAIRNRYCPNGWYMGELRVRLWDCVGMDYITGKLNIKFEEQK